MTKRLALILLSICLSTNLYSVNKPYSYEDIFTISVSDKLELRKEKDASTKLLRDTLKLVGPSQMVFQQKGLAKKDKNALKKYCRIMIITYKDGSCPYPTTNESNFSQSDLEELIASCKDELAPGQTFIKKPRATIKVNNQGSTLIRINYTRTGTQGEVTVSICYLFNYKYAIKSVFSYRTSESALWKTAIEDAINSISWTEPFIAREITGTESATQQCENSELPWLFLLAAAFLIGSICLISKVLLKPDQPSSLPKTSIRVPSKEKKMEPQPAVSKETKNIPVPSQKTQISASSPNNTTVKVAENRYNYQVKVNREVTDAKRPKITTTILPNTQPAISLKKEENLPLETIPKQIVTFTQYELPECERTDQYPFYHAPEEGTVVFPHRRHKVRLRGFTEQRFEQKLREAFSSYDNYDILGNVCIATAEGYQPYEPDIAIIERKDVYSIRVDIEIDEPYGGLDKTPIHYIGCGDTYRDNNLTNHGWVVIRFSERQIHEEPSECINYIMSLLSQIDEEIEEEDFDYPTPDNRWTEIEAQKMAATNFREELLDHEFGEMETDKATITMEQTQIESKASELVCPVSLPVSRPVNIDKSTTKFSRDRNISFEPNEHIYLYKGRTNLTPVSTVISKFFEKFDALWHSERMARKTGNDQCHILEEWDCKGEESRYMGTFLHQQIEARLKGKATTNKTTFKYDGEYVEINRTISISKELAYLENFLEDNPIEPFRTEWHIYDLNLGIAGTVDLICRNGDEFDIYDWKRSHKASPDERIWNYGINGMEHIPDINFYHYALQQNLYRYILERKYGIKINDMHIVVLHSDYDNYEMYEIPRLDKELEIITSYLTT